MNSSNTIEWTISNNPIAYEDALAVMEDTVADIRAGTSPEQIWLLEHPPLYTAGTSAKASDLIDAKFPVHETGRGGQYTYHGPGQRVGYVMLDLKKQAKNRGLSREGGNLQDPRLHGESNPLKPVPDIKRYVCDLEQWIIDTLQEFDIKGERREGRVGIWVKTPHPSSQGSDTLSRAEREEKATPEQGEGEMFIDKKIAAIGVRVRHWVTYHGISINLNPDLDAFSGIVPCGISDAGVTSFEDLGVDATMEELDLALQKNFRF